MIIVINKNKSDHDILAISKCKQSIHSVAAMQDAEKQSC